MGERTDPGDSESTGGSAKDGGMDELTAQLEEILGQRAYSHSADVPPSSEATESSPPGPGAIGGMDELTSRVEEATGLRAYEHLGEAPAHPEPGESPSTGGKRRKWFKRTP